MLKNLPNILTISRILFVPVFPFVFFSGSPNAHYHALIILLIVGITDFLDGAIARKYNLITKLGTALDPLADKLMLVTVLICYWISKILPGWLVTVVFINEISLIFIGLYLYFKKDKHVVPANLLGKTATLVFFLAVVVILSAPEARFLKYFAFFAVGLKITAFCSYIRNHILYLKENKKSIK